MPFLLFSKKGPSGFSAYSTAEDVTLGIDGSGLTAIVTGASNGIGTETTRVLALRGVHVIMAVRNVVAGKDVREKIIAEIPTAKIDVMELDLSSMASVRKFASEFKSADLPLNILINNAGIMATPFKLSTDGIEMQFATNHLGHFLLTHLLLDTMKKTARDSKIEGRIVNVSSAGHGFANSAGIPFDKDELNDEKGYSSVVAYGRSKLANILHANELARQLKEEGVDITANSLHPGSITTNLLQHRKIVYVLLRVFNKFFKTVPQGASTECYIALNPQVKGVTGKYFSDNNIEEPQKQATDTELAKKLWDFSLTLIQ
ncbi:short-chain dehydrogenase TIC 32, chloroplastic-like isoform X2 [Tasmannia lanceolata]|uniref:short-chain dehydrogenase TIC 32, chloroplastic-like isoform X2 n=1 Tax=Tasmannia lanceolata TaxID=3420 RepID=UPI004062AF5D